MSLISNRIPVYKRLQTNSNNLQPNKFPIPMNLCNRDLRKQSERLLS